MTFPFSTVQEDYSRYGFSEASTEFRATKLVESLRWREMDRWQKYFQCKQHDHKRYDFDGREIRTSDHSQGLISTAQTPWYVPLKMRKPSAPYRIGKRMVTSFTTMVFGESRWPDLKISNDEDSQEFINALVTEVGLSTKMIQLRNVGGSVGTCGLSWCYYDGVPTVEVHNGKCIHVHEWEDKSNLIPKHVTEIYKYEKDFWDPTKKLFVREWFWHRQDWTTTSDVSFKDVKVKGKEEPYWEVDEENTVVHNDGYAHFIYVQNIPPIEGIDGVPDCDGVWDQMDSIDILISTIVRGGILNLDPTLKLRMDPEIVDYAFVRKGSDNALLTGETGDASYMELAGTSVTAGLALLKEMRVEVLETTECVIPDPDKVAAAGTSSVALKMVYAPMLGKCDMLREQYGKAIRSLLKQMLLTAQKLYAGRVEPRMVDDGEEDVEVSGYVKLPPRMVTDIQVDEDGTEIEVVKSSPHHPGQSSLIELVWGPYFRTTAADQSQVTTSLVQATGGKAFCSRKSAVELFASVVSRDPSAMLEELDQDDERSIREQQAVMDSMGVEPGSPTDPLDHEATEEGESIEGSEEESGDTATRIAVDGEQEQSQVAQINLTATDIASVVTVNEARASQGLGPMLLSSGAQDPDGSMKVSQYKLKLEREMKELYPDPEEEQAPIPDAPMAE